MFDSLLPKSEPFFEMLLEQNACLRTVSEHLIAMTENFEGRDESLKCIAIDEERADKVNLRIVRALSRTFITPIDREDLLRISQMQETCIDEMQHFATRLHIYECARMRFPTMKLLQTVKGMLELEQSMLEGLAQKRDAHKTRAFRALREDCDVFLSVGVAELVDIGEPSSQDLLEIIKWSQLYDRLEHLISSIVKTAETIEEAVLKYA